MNAKNFIKTRKQQDKYLGNIMDSSAWGEVEKLLEQYAALSQPRVSDCAFIADDPETEEQVIVNAYTIEKQ